MAVVAVVNRKGGSGKSTLSTNIACWCAWKGWNVMLGDVDRQQSIRSWFSRRSTDLPKITTWAQDHNKVFRAPPGTTHVVLDTPGALYGYELAKLLVWVDAVVVPIGPSIFDLDASVQFLSEIKQHPKVRGGRCSVNAVGMRWPRDRIEAWVRGGGAEQHGIPLQAMIPDAAHYRGYLESGSSFFDELDKFQGSDYVDWMPLTGWLEQVWRPRGMERNRISEKPVLPPQLRRPLEIDAPGRQENSVIRPAEVVGRSVASIPYQEPGGATQGGAARPVSDVIVDVPGPRSVQTNHVITIGDGFDDRPSGLGADPVRQVLKGFSMESTAPNWLRRLNRSD